MPSYPTLSNADPNPNPNPNPSPEYRLTDRQFARQCGIKPTRIRTSVPSLGAEITVREAAVAFTFCGVGVLLAVGMMVGLGIVGWMVVREVGKWLG